jgi:hypothetical protein
VSRSPTYDPYIIAVEEREGSERYPGGAGIGASIYPINYRNCATKLYFSYLISASGEIR